MTIKALMGFLRKPWMVIVVISILFFVWVFLSWVEVVCKNMSGIPIMGINLFKVAGF